jgi:hypothetical protein
MDINDLKPDFKKIAFALNVKDSTLQKIKAKMLGEENDEEFSENTDSKIKLESLLEEYHLQVHYNDFLFLILYFHFSQRFSSKHFEDYSQRKIQKWELVESLHFLSSFDISDLNIELKHQKLKLAVPIKDVGTIKLFQKFLLKYYIKLQEGTNKEQNNIDFKYWESKINLAIDEIILFPKAKKGRRDIHHYTGEYIEILQRYLQEYTDLKADRGKIISRKQSLFIYKFLNFYELIREGLSYEQDNIRHILKKHFEQSDDNQ